MVNGENAAGGNGITPKLAIELMRAGADVLTLGDHAWDQRDILPYFATEPRLVRPANFPAGTPGAGSVVVSGNGHKLGVLNCSDAPSWARRSIIRFSCSRRRSRN